MTTTTSKPLLRRPVITVAFPSGDRTIAFADDWALLQAEGAQIRRDTPTLEELVAFLETLDPSGAYRVLAGVLVGTIGRALTVVVLRAALEHGGLTTLRECAPPAVQAADAGAVEALAFYAARDNWLSENYTPSPTDYDAGARARVALRALAVRPWTAAE